LQSIETTKLNTQAYNDKGLATKNDNITPKKLTEIDHNIAKTDSKNLVTDSVQIQNAYISQAAQVINNSSTVNEPIAKEVINATIVKPAINTTTDTNNVNASTIAKPDSVFVAIIPTILKTNTTQNDSIIKKDNTTSLWKIKPYGLVFQAHTNLPNVSNFNSFQEDKTNQNKSNITVSGKEYQISVLYSTAIHPKINVHIGISYQQSNFTLNKEVTQSNIKRDTSITYKDSAIAVLDTLNNPVVDTLGNPVMTFTPVADENIQTTFNTKTVQYFNTSTFGYVGIPVEVQFKQNIIGKLQLQVLTGFRWQYLMYQYNSSKDLETQVKPQSQNIKLYGSVGLGYAFYKHISLSVLLHTSYYNASGFSLKSTKLVSQILYTPEIRLGYIF
ncbi:MAG: hypothetical protein RL711_1419, partial [Bacteroidota bacterium]